MADQFNEPKILEPEYLEPGSVPAQPEAESSKKFNAKVVGGIAAVILVIGLATSLTEPNRRRLPTAHFPLSRRRAMPPR